MMPTTVLIATYGSNRSAVIQSVNFARTGRKNPLQSTPNKVEYETQSVK